MIKRQEICAIKLHAEYASCSQFPMQQILGWHKLVLQYHVKEPQSLCATLKRSGKWTPKVENWE